MKALDCLFIGSMTKDILMQVDSPPASDQRISASNMVVACGGVSAVAGAAHQHLHGITGIISAIGNDDSGQYILSFAKKQEFEYSKIFTFPNHCSSTSLVQVEKNGKRCLTCLNGCIEQLTFNMLDCEVFHHTKYVHLGVMHPALMLEICRYCKEQTSAEISLDSGNMSKELSDLLLPYVDIMIPDNKTTARTLHMSEQDACRYYIEHGAKIACITAADEGTYAYDGKTMYYISAPSVKVVDTTGAGDNFHGALLYCLGHGMSLPDAVKFSNIFASLTCEALGGSTAIPDSDRVMDLFRSDIVKIERI